MHSVDYDISNKHIYSELVDNIRNPKSSCTKVTANIDWHLNRHGPNITVRKEKPYIALRDKALQSTDGVRSSYGFKHGSHLIKFTFKDTTWGSHCGIGVCTAKANLHSDVVDHLFGMDQHSWILDIPSSELLHNGSMDPLNWALTAETTFYMILDCDHGELFYYTSTVNNFQAFTGLPKGVSLYPCASMVYVNAEVRISLRDHVLQKKPIQDKVASNENQQHIHKSEENDSLSQTDVIYDNKMTMNHKGNLDRLEDAHDLGSGSSKLVRDNSAFPISPELGSMINNTDIGETGVVKNYLNSKANKGREASEDNSSSTVQSSAVIDQPEVNDSIEDDDENEDDIHRTTERMENPSHLSIGQPNTTLNRLKTGDGFRKPVSLSLPPYPTEAELVDGLDNIPKTPPPALYSSPDTKEKRVNLEEPEPCDIEYTETSTLNSQDEYQVQMAHGWDMIHRGGMVHLYPSIPQICVPLPRLNGKVQGARSRRGFSSGKHKWLIRELVSYRDRDTLSIGSKMETTSGLWIGVATADQRQFNFGFQKHGLGRHLWLLEVSTGNIWHPESEHRILHNENDGKTRVGNLAEGVEVTLNFYKRTLTICSGTAETVIPYLRREVLHPFVMFDMVAIYPVEIKYLKGPTEYLTDLVKELRTMSANDLSFFVNYQGFSRQLNTKTVISLEGQTENEALQWGEMSSCLSVKGFLTSDTVKVDRSPHVGEQATAKIKESFRGGRHRIHFQTSHLTDWAFGLATDGYDVSGSLNLSCASKKSGLGKDLNSWSWNVKTKSLYHAGNYLGQYPSVSVDVDLEKYNTVELLIDFNSSGYHIAAFSLISSTGASVNLGIAFVALPLNLTAAVELLPTADFASGPFVKALYAYGTKEASRDKDQKHESTVCVML